MSTEIVVAKRLDLSGWGPEFDGWPMDNTWRPVALMASATGHEYLTKNAYHVFMVSNASGSTRYMVVHESGCSCYEPAHAAVDYMPTLEAAMQAFNNWRRGDAHSWHCNRSFGCSCIVEV